MKKAQSGFLKVVFFILLPIGLLFAFGFRFHPEALKSRLGYENRDFREVTLTSGRVFVGEILNETPDSLKITFEGGAMHFSPNEIRSMKPIDPNSAAYGQYADEVVLLPKRPIFTFRKEDRLFYEAPKKKVYYIDSNLKKE